MPTPRIDYSHYYRKWHDGSDAHYEDTARWYKRLLAPVLESLPGDAALLDVGCGTGLLVHALLQAGFKNVQGFDISPEQVADAQERSLPCSLVEADHLQRLVEDRPESVDCVFLMDVLEHVAKDEQLQLLSAAQGILKPRGRLVISVPNANSTFGARWLFNDWTHHWSFTEHSLDFVALNAGFERVDFLPYEFVTRPRYPWILRPGVAYWCLNRLMRAVRRLQAVGEMGSQGWKIPLGLNLLAVCHKR